MPVITMELNSHASLSASASALPGRVEAEREAKLLESRLSRGA